MRKAAVYALLFVLLTLPFQSTRADDDATACETEYDYGATKGPGQWGSLKAEWRPCDAGRYQSPIILGSTTRDLSLPTITRSYPATSYTIKNNGLNLKLTPVSSPGYLEFAGGTRAILDEFHFHVPAEHVQINQPPYAAEMHAVHKFSDGRIVAATVLFRQGTADATVQSILDRKPGSCNTGTISGLSLNALIPASNHYFSYFGSLTTPPCTEGVTFIVYAQARTLSANQLSALRIAAATGNARPIPAFVRYREN